MTNPFNYTTGMAEAAVEGARLDIGLVTSVPNHTLGDDNLHVVKVRLRGASTEDWATVPVDAYGDVHLPPKGEEVWAIVGHIKGQIPIVLRYIYMDTEDDSIEPPAYTAGERIIGHTASDAFIKFDNDGNVYVNPGSGKLYLADESGSTQPVARQGDPVSVDTGTGNGTITSGSSNVESS